MKQINNYISEKLYIDKNYKNNSLHNKYLIVIAYNNEYAELEAEWSDALIESDFQENIFVIPKEDAINFVKKSRKYPSSPVAYEIPIKYDNLDDLEQDWYNGDIGEYSLKKYEIN